MNAGSRPRSTILYRSARIPYFQVVSYDFNKSKNIVIICSLWANAVLIVVSNLTRWSIVDLFLLQCIEFR